MKAINLLPHILSCVYRNENEEKCYNGECREDIKFALNKGYHSFAAFTIKTPIKIWLISDSYSNTSFPNTCNFFFLACKWCIVSGVLGIFEGATELIIEILIEIRHYLVALVLKNVLKLFGTEIYQCGENDEVNHEETTEKSISVKSSFRFCFWGKET